MNTTTKTINLKDNKVTEIRKGTLLKRGMDMFLVAEVGREYKHVKKVNCDPIYDSLFNDGLSYSKKEEIKYALISLSTGGNYFGCLYNLTDLLSKISNTRGFQIVENIEINEL